MKAGIRDLGLGIRVACVLLAIGFGSGAVAQSAPTAPTAPTPAPPAASADVSADDIADAPEAAPADAAPPATAGAAAAQAGAPATRTPGSANPAPADPSLLPVFKQFGEEPGLVALMDDFMVRLLADPRTHESFANADQAGIKRHLVEQFCVILGGPCTYTGRDMAAAHKGLGIDRAAFNALVEDLQLAMDARKIPFRAQNKLLAKLAPMHREIEQ